MNWFGIDAGKQRLHTSWLRDPETGRVRSKALANTPQGHAELLAWARKQSKAATAQLAFVIEATGVYHEAVAMFLHEAGARVCVVNPLHVKRFAESHGIQMKNDSLDGTLLARFGHERRPEPWEPPPPEVRHLQALLRRLDALERDRQRERNRLEKTQVEGGPKDVLDSLQLMLEALDTEIERLRRNIDNHINGHPELKQHRALLETIPGVGPTLSSWFLALFLGRRFRSAKQVAAYLGLVPKTHESGTSVRKRPRLTKTGDARWRARLYMPALAALRSNDDIRDLAERMTAAGKPTMAAVGAAMRKLVHIAFGVFKHQQPYCQPTA